MELLKKDLQLFFESGYPLIAVKSSEELNILQSLSDVLADYDTHSWDATLGSKTPDSEEFVYQEGTLEEYLGQWRCKKLPKKNNFVFAQL